MLRICDFLRRRKEGVSAIEFALIAPVFALIVVASLDLGMTLYGKFQIEAAVSTGSSYVLVNRSMADSEKGGELATRVAGLVAQSGVVKPAKANVTVNNGPEAVFGESKIQQGGKAGNADLCYCPTGSASAPLWGASRQCGTPCPGGGVAGRFVTIWASRPFQPLLGRYGFLKGGDISASAMVRVQ